MDKLIKDTLKNTLLSVAIFGGLLLVLWLAELLMPSLSLLHWDNAAWCVGLPASIIGVAYVLTIRDPKNYIGFYPGILMSLLLSVQFFLQGNYDLTILQLAIFVPFQTKSILQWSKSPQHLHDSIEIPKQVQDEGATHADAGQHLLHSNQSTPTYLVGRSLYLSLALFFIIIVLDYALATLVINKDAWSNHIPLKLAGACMIASSALSNYWLIYRKTDAWFYWVLYSIAGIVFYVIIQNIFSVVLFCFFLVINAMAGVAWVRITPRRHTTAMLLLLAAVFVSCGKASVPKPYGYYRLNIPDTAYRQYQYKDICSFLLSENAKIEQRQDSLWFNIVYPSLNATIHCSYLPLRHNIGDLTDDAQEFVFKHAGKAAAINEQEYYNHDKHIYSILYQLDGNIASPYQFFITDSTKNFLRASVYFETLPNQDSLQPAIDYIELDLRRMIESFDFLRSASLCSRSASLCVF